MLLGAHLSVAGGLANALREAQRLRADCVQVFTRNQRQWRASPIGQDERRQWREQLHATRWRTTLPDLPPEQRVVSHGSYLVNLASPNDPVGTQSLAAHRAELERCEALGIPHVVIHPGAHLGSPRSPRDPNDLDAAPSRAERAGLARIIQALDRIHRDLAGYQTVTCLETTTGSGTNLGYQFQQLRFVREHVRQPERVGFCLDTCHVTAAGYDMATDAAATAVLERFDGICGLGHVRAVHVNDSLGLLGSRKDRHAHLGRGTCGRACFQAVLNHPALRRVPMLLETPKGRDDKGREWDRINLRRLRAMGGRRRHAPALTTV